MKKDLALCIVFALLIFVLSAAADSVWMPMDDFFAGTWDPESDAYCGHESNPLYIAAGPEGYVRAVYTPVDQQIVGTYPNGTEFQINFICGVGDDRWGTVYAVRLPGETVFTPDWIGKSGYISLKDLVPACDTDVFTELNSNSIFGYTEEFDPCEPYFPFVIWSYPNSNVQLDIVNEQTLEWFCPMRESGYFPIRVSTVYKDPDGDRWLSVHLLKPETRGWLNLDHPMEGAVIQNFE